MTEETELNLEDVDFLDPRRHVAVPVTVNEVEVMMYPLSPLVAPRFKKLMTKALPAIRDLFFPYEHEHGQRTNKEKLVNGTVSTEITLAPADVPLSLQHRQFRTATMKDLAECFTDKQHLVEIALCIMDSCRDSIPRDKNKPFTPKQAEQFLGMMLLPDMFALIGGLVRANLKSFPLGQRAAEKMVARVSDAIDGTEKDGSEQPTSEEKEESESADPSPSNSNSE